MINLSFSAAQRYILSPRAWFNHYVLKLRPIKQSSALVFGSALDEAFNSLLNDKKLGNDIYVNKAKLAFDAEFQKTDKNLINISKADGSYDELWDKGHILIEEYAAQVLPKIDEVIAVQLDIKEKNELGDTFVGKVDAIVRIGDKVYIADNKSSSITYKEDSANESAQLASYYELLRDQYKLDAVLYIVIPKKLRKQKLPRVEIKFIFGQVSDKIIEKTFQDYDAVLTGIRNGEFICTRSQVGGCCSMPWPCDFKSFCDSGGKDMSGLKVKEDQK